MIMKNIKFIAVILAVALCVCSVPFTFAVGETGDVISFESRGSAVYGKNYFTVGLEVYDKRGNYICAIPEDEGHDAVVHTIGDNCIITLDKTEKAYSVFAVENGNMVKKASYLEQVGSGLEYETCSVRKFTDGKFTVVSRTEVTFGSPEDGSNAPTVGREEPAGFTLLDSYGNEVYSANGCKGIYASGGVLVTEDNDGNTKICVDLYADTLEFEDFDYHVVCGTDMGDLVFEEDGDYGLVTWDGDKIEYPFYDEIVEYGEYYICKDKNLWDDGVTAYDSSVTNRNGDLLGTPYAKNIIAYSEDVFLDVDPYGVYALKHTNDRYDEVIIDKGDVASSDGNVFYVASSDTNSGKLYNDIGEVLISGEGCTGEFSSDAEAGIIVGSFDSKDCAVYDMEGNIIRRLDCDMAYTTQNGYIVCEEANGEWIEKDGKAITGKHRSCEEYFEMAGCDVFVMRDDAGCTVYIAKKSVPFSDIDVSHWAYESVVSAYSDGIMNGVGGGRFDPNGTVTRAQVVTALWRMAGCPDPVPSHDYEFTVIKPWYGEWYATAFRWAISVGLTTGVSAENPDKFDIAAERLITRVEMVTFINRFAEIVDKRYVDYTVDTSAFADSADIPTWCSVEFCYVTGIIKGKAVGEKVYLAPEDTLTRAELAAILERY